jgi:hypothetical protein
MRKTLLVLLCAGVCASIAACDAATEVANEAIESTAEAAGEAAEAAGEAAEAAGEAAEAAGEAVEGAAEATQNAAEGAVEATGAAAEGAAEATQNAAEGAVEATGNAIDGAVEAVEGATSQPTSQPGASNHFGAPFNSDAHPIELATALETCAGTGSACKVTGTIDRVCQTRGCWFTLTEDGVDETIRVRMQDYAFFVPRDAVGKRVVFEGVMTREEVSIETAQHYADDEAAAGTAPARQITAPEQTYAILITGVEILNG